MSRIDELIAEHCPDGVRHVALSEVAEYSPTRINAADLDSTSFVGVDNLVADKGGRIDASYLPNPARLTAYEPGDILLGNIRPHLKKVWHATNSGGCSGDVLAIRIKQVAQAALTPEFLYYALSSDGFFTYNMQHAKGAKMPRGNKAAILNYVVPVPPLEVQRAIVEVLDTFSKLEAELEAELEARKQQYEHYRAELLAKAAELGRPVELGELGRIVTGRTPKSSDASAWGDHIDFVTPSDIKNGMKWIRTPARRLSASGAEVLSKAIVPQGSLLVTCIGADMGKTVLNGNPCATNQQINSLTLDPGVDTNFVFHVLTSMRDKIRAQGERAGGTMPIINKSDFSKIRIALPSFEEQQRIASILDQFDALVNDLSVGLPAELAARRQQYEYYRDKLLAFKELEVTA